MTGAAKSAPPYHKRSDACGHFFVELSERRLNQSLARVHSINTRAVALLSLLAVLMSGLWAVSLPMHHKAGTPMTGFMLGFGLLTAAMLLSGISLLLTAEYDSPKLQAFYDNYSHAPDGLHHAYFTAVIGAVTRNNQVMRQKGTLLLAAIVALLCARVTMAAIPLSQ